MLFGLRELVGLKFEVSIGGDILTKTSSNVIWMESREQDVLGSQHLGVSLRKTPPFNDRFQMSSTPI